MNFQYSTSQVLKLSLMDAIRTQSQRMHHHSSPALLQHGRELPKDASDCWDLVSSGNLDSFKILWSLTTGAGRYHIIHQRDNTNKTLLHIATEKGHLNIISYLVEKCSADLNVIDDRNNTPLHYACNSGLSDIAYYLVKQGADITMKSDSGSIPLFYYVRQNSEENLLINLSVISLLTPPHNSFSLTNNRKQTILHYACMNKSHSMPFTVLFLLENGADRHAVDEKGNKCWEYLDSQYENILSSFIDYEKSNVKKTSLEDFKSFSYNSFASIQKSKFLFDEFTLSPHDLLLRNLKKAQEAIEELKGIEGKEEEIEQVKKRIEKGISILLNNGLVNDRPQHLNSFGHSAYDLIYDSLQFTNKTARKLKREGRVMGYKGITSHITVYYYYFLFNDSLLLFDDNQIKSKLKGENNNINNNNDNKNDNNNYKEPKVFPLSSLKVFSIPNGHGLVEGVQLVFKEKLFGYPRKSFTLLFPSEEEKKEFFSDIISSFEYNSQFFLSSPSINDLGDVIKEGYLIKQGNVLNKFFRVYVRLTSSDLFYYDNPEAREITGRVNISTLTFKVDRKKLMIRWCDQKIGRSYAFCCLNNNDFDDWQEVVMGTSSRSSFHFVRRSNASQLSFSDFKNIIVKITIKAGRDLAAKDYNGRSDPYCVIGLARPDNFRFIGEKKKTPVIKKTLQPIWNSDNSFEFEPFIKGTLFAIRVECWDWDFGSNNDFMGFTILDPSLFKPNSSSETWHKLLPSKNSDEAVSGDLNISISVRIK